MNTAWLDARRDEAVAAFMLLTRLPVARLSRRAVPPGDAVWAWPLAGAAIGLIGAAAFWAGRAAGLPPPVAAIWSVAAAILATGGLHEDGLADAIDGFGGGRTRERKLDIMRDSRIGSFGALALMIAVGLRVAALAILADPAAVALASIAAAVVGRGAMLGLVLALRPARPEGLAAPLGSASKRRVLCGLALAALAAALPGGLAAIVAAALACVVFGRLAARHLGGYTGDVLGAVEQVAECAALTACLSRFA